MHIIGILRENHRFQDARVALTPDQIAELQGQYPQCRFIVQPDKLRCFSDNEYRNKGIEVSEDIDACDLLIGINEVDINTLLPEKTYLFFSTIINKQSYNKSFLQELIKQKITLVDLAHLRDDLNNRLVGSGRWAGIVGAYNGLRAYGLRNELFELKPACTFPNKNELFKELTRLVLPPIKILITGGGRVAGGAREVLAQLEIHKIIPSDFIKKSFEYPVFTVVEPVNYVKHLDNNKFKLPHFYEHPEEYKSIFQPYTKVTDILMACHYWDPRSPVLITLEQMKQRSFNISVIADISCNINGPIPSTIRTSTIQEPFYGYNAKLNSETPAFDKDSITVMAVENLARELPRDASEDFGRKMAKKVLPLFFDKDENEIIEKATIIKNGKLTTPFEFLMD